MLFRIFVFLAGVGILYGSGWNLMIGGELKIIPSLQILLTGLGGLSYGDVLFNSDGYIVSDMSYFLSGDLAVIQVDKLYYGFYNSHRYFNSAILEWAGIGGGIGVIWDSVFSANDDSEDIVEKED